MRPARRLVAAMGAAAVGAAVAVPVPATAQPGVPGHGAATGIVVRDGRTQPAFSTQEAITGKAYVETRVDSDHDGQRDRVHLRISRPAETAADGDLDVPVILKSSPYFFGTNQAENHDVDFRRLPQGDLEHPGNQPDDGEPGRTRRPPTLADLAPPGVTGDSRADGGLPGWLDDYFVPRGYAVVYAESIGTAHSGGCPTSGDMQETRGIKAVVDWLNGRARAWTEDGAPVRASWTDGRTGMIGISYNGTLPNMVATTGVEGLETIVPISAISSWYDYYRANGLVVAPGGYQGEDADVLAEFVVDRDDCAGEIAVLTARQDRHTGDYSRFWHARDYVHRAGRVDSSVWVIHGRDDWNVKTEHFAQWWRALRRNDVPRKMWLHNGGHGGTEHGGAFVPTLHRWFDHWLYGLDNGVMDEPRVDIQREDGSWDTHGAWPDTATERVRLRFVAGEKDGTGSLAQRPEAPGRQPVQDLVDNGRERTAEQLAANPGQADPNRLAYRTAKLEQPVRMSGTPRVRLRAAVENRNAANLTALLVDYGPAGSEPRLVTRGWMDPQNRHSDSVSKPLEQGKFYWFRWNMQPEDYVFEAGHRIGVVIISTDHDYTLRPLPGTELSIDAGHSLAMLPLVGGL